MKESILDNSNKFQVLSTFLCLSGNCGDYKLHIDKVESTSFSRNKKIPRNLAVDDKDCELTKHQSLMLDSTPYLSKTFGKNKIARKKAVHIIGIVNKNTKSKNSVFQMSRDNLTKIFGSDKVVSNILNALVAGGILKHNGYHNRLEKVARKWWLAEGFKNAHLKLIGFKKYTESKGLKKRSILSDTSLSEATIEKFTTSPSENSLEEPKEVFSKQVEAISGIAEFQIDFPENSAMIFEEIPPTELNNNTMNQELTPEEEYQQKLMVSSLSPYFKKRFAQFGLDIYGNSYCDCCKEMLPNALFSVSNSGILNRKCKICWDTEESTKTENVKDPLQVTKAVGAFAKNLRKGYSVTFITKK